MRSEQDQEKEINELKELLKIDKDALNTQTWKRKYEKIGYMFNSDDELLKSSLTPILALIKIINSTTNYREIFPDQKTCTFFIEEFFYNTTKEIMEKKFSQSDAIATSNQILQEILIFIIKTFNENNFKLAETLQKLFLYRRDGSFQLYKDANPVQDFFDELETKDNNIQFVNTLKVNDIVDAIKFYEYNTRNFQTKVYCWSRAQIISISQLQTQIQYLEDMDNIKYISNHQQLAPLGSKCLDWDWRMNLNVNDQLDMQDTEGSWYNSTILEIKEFTENQNKFKICQIGFRVYHDDGNKIDSSIQAPKKKYFGWGPSFDEWVPLTSPRLAKLNTFAKPQYLNTFKDDEYMDDSNDSVIVDPTKKIYALQRPNKQSLPNSLFTVKIVNQFAELGGFKLILDKIQNKQQWCPIELTAYYTGAICNIAHYLHKNFIIEYVPLFKEAILNNLLNSPDQNIRNFTRERLDFFYDPQGLGKLLKRYYSMKEKETIVQELKLEISFKCFFSDFLDRKIQGLKGIMEILKHAKDDKKQNLLKGDKPSIISEEQMMQLIQEKQVFQKLYSSQNYHLISRSGDFIKYLLQDDEGEGLSIENLQVIWIGSTKNDIESKQAIYKLISDVSFSLKKNHKDFLINKLLEQDYKSLIKDDIDLIYEISRTQQDTEIKERLLKFYWNIISDPAAIQSDITDKIISNYMYLVKEWDMKPKRHLFFEQFKDNIDKGINVLPTMKIIKELYDYLPSNISSFESFAQPEAMQLLFEKFKIVELVIKNIKQMKQNLLKNINTGNNTYIQETQLDRQFTNKQSYLDNISQRVEFLNFIYANLPKKMEITFDIISQVWDCIVKDSLIQKERDIIYKWFSQISSSSSTLQIKIEDLTIFFEQKMCDPQDIQNLTEEGFNCFKSVFCIINEKDGKIKKIIPDTNNNSYLPTQYSGQSNNYGVERKSYSYNTTNQKNQEFDQIYFVLVDPLELKGSPQIWEIILKNNIDKVVSEALEFYNKLYQSLSPQLQERETEIKDQFLKKAYNQLHESIKNNSPELYQTRCIECLQSILDNSEKEGNGGLKSLMQLIKGEQISLHFSSQFYNSKKFTLKVYTNQTIHDLLIEVSKQIKCTKNEVKLVIDKTNKEIKNIDSGKAIADLKIQNGDRLTYSKKDISIEDAPLVIAGEINPKAVNVFTQMFQQHAKDDKMKPEQLASFVNVCLPSSDFPKVDDQRITDLLKNNDKDNKGYLSLEDFCSFYKQACRIKPPSVFSNMRSHGFRSDLKRYDEVEVEQLDITKLPRYILSRDEKFYKMAFDLLHVKGAISNKTWNLLSRLPISPQIYEQIIMLEGVRGANEKKDWNKLLDISSIYNLLYSLYVIEYLMEQKEDEDDQKLKMEQLLQVSQEAINYKQTWRSDFIELGGFDHLYKIFMNLSNQNLNNLENLTKTIMSFILKIFQNYIVAAFSVTNDKIYSLIEQIKLIHIPLDSIIQNINQDSTDDIQNQIDLNNSEKSLAYRRNQSYEMTTSTNNMGNSGIQNNNNNNNNQMQQSQQGSTGKNKEFKLIEEKNEQFKIFVKSLQQSGLTEKILQKFELDSFLKLLYNLSIIMISKEDQETEDRVILEHSLLLISAMILYKPALFEKMTTQFDIKTLFQLGIFNSKQQNIRKVFNHTFLIICKESLSQNHSFPLQYLLQIMIQQIPKQSSDKNNKSNPSQYFELFCALIDISQTKNSQIDKITDFENLAQTIITYLKEHNSTEIRGSNNNDKVLIGFLNLLDVILRARQDLKDKLGDKKGADLVNEIFKKCLFDLNSTDTIDENIDIMEYDQKIVKCKSETSRKAAYKLLQTVCSNSNNNLEILMSDGFHILLNRIPQISQQALSYQNDPRPPGGFSGIKNLSNICYMNAMLQQLFMTPQFRYLLLMADDQKEDDLVAKDPKTLIDNNLLHQMQKMFGFLENSDRSEFNPTEFCFSFRPNGEPVNVAIQQDSQEFMNQVLDKIEISLKDTPFKHILEDVYGGKICSQIICLSCHNVTNTMQNFLNLSLEVKNMKNIYDSFTKFIQGEVISDFTCSGCHKKVNITKRICLSKLPNVLFIHLQRIIFDLDLLQNTKVNTKLEFPTELNIEPYTLEGLSWRDLKDKQVEGHEKLCPPEDQTEYQYKLVGVIVHTGTADFGHYYSYIDINRSEEKLSNFFAKQDVQEKWNEFNDSRVSEFNIKNMESECFGGSMNDDDNNFSGWGGRRGDNAKNAYLLVYEKQIKHPIKLLFKNHEQIESTMKRINVPYNLETQVEKPESSLNQEQQKKTEESKKEESSTSLDVSKNSTQVQSVNLEQTKPEEQKLREIILNVPYYNIKKYIPRNIFKKIWEDNKKFMFEKHLLNEEFFKYIKDISNNIQLPDLNEENCPFGYYKDYKNISEEQVQQYQKQIDMILKIILELLVKSTDKQTMDPLFNKLKNLLKLVPNYSYAFLEKFAFDIGRPQKIIELMTQQVDKNTREIISNILSFSMNLAILFEDFNLDINKFSAMDEDSQQTSKQVKELCILAFLQKMKNLLPTDIGKNWMKMGAYFEFWLNFSKGGDAQVHFLHQVDFIAELIDFYLGRDSTLKLHPVSKKESIGNKYAQLDFDPLIETIYNIVQSSVPLSYPQENPFFVMDPNKKYYILSENSKRGFFSHEFWYKTLTEERGGSGYSTYGFKVNLLCKLIDMYSYENRSISEIIAFSLIRSLSIKTYDIQKNVGQAMTHFLQISDSITSSRNEWILGIPGLRSHFKHQIRIKGSDNKDILQYGLFGAANMDTDVFEFKSQLKHPPASTLLDTILNNKRRQDSYSQSVACLLLKYLFIMCEHNEATLNYVFYLPPINYKYAKFTDFIRPFIETYIQDQKKFMNSSLKPELADLKEIYEKFELKINQKLQNFALSTPLYQYSENQIQGVYKPYIIGQTLKDDIITIYKGEDQLVIKQIDSTVFVMESQPAGTANLLIPSDIINDYKISTFNIESKSLMTCFIEYKSQKGMGTYNKNQQINWNYEEEEDDFFKNQNNKDDVVNSDGGNWEQEDAEKNNKAEENQLDQNNQQEEEKQQQSQKKKKNFPANYTQCVRYFMISNDNETDHILVHFKVSYKNTNQNSNLINTFQIHQPLSIIMQPKKYIQSQIYMKLDPELDWPEFIFDIRTEVVQNNKQNNSWPYWLQSHITQEEQNLLSDN